MIHIDEKFKDASPVATYQKISSILQNNQLEVNESWTDSGIDNCYSLQVRIGNTGLSTNGKGVTEDLTRASGYAELMERLQSGFLGFTDIHYGDLHFNDKITVARSELLSYCGEWLQMIADTVTGSEHQPCTVESLVDFCCIYGKKDTVDLLPFYNATEHKMTYFPVLLIHMMYTTNGLAAGNSPEEAIVQAFSEIVERRCQRTFLLGGLTPPTIPEDYLRKFPTSYQIITALREAGYHVIVKDCSMGSDFPTIATVVSDQETHKYHVHLGASPVFEIALERSLTELFQGKTLSKITTISDFCVGTKRSSQELEFSLIKGSGIYPIEFFGEKASFPFNEFPDRSNLTNKDLLSYVLTYVEDRNLKMLVRDMSHLGFPTYRVLIPGYTEVYQHRFVGNPLYYKILCECYHLSANMENASFESLYTFTQFYKIEPSLTGIPSYSKISGLPFNISVNQDHYWSLLSAAHAEWCIGNAKQAYQYAARAKSYAPKEDAAVLDCIVYYLYLRLNKYPGSYLTEVLPHFYSEETIRRVQALLAAPSPFFGLLPKCRHDCEACPHRAICERIERDSVYKKVLSAIEHYDNKAAFEKLDSIFSEF